VLVPYGAGAAEFAVDVRVTALEAFFTHVDAVLGAHETGFSIRMLDARSHIIPNFFYNFFIN
jgi:hypothetical protein